MKKMFLASLAVLLALPAGGCFGPQKLTRQLDDGLNQAYVDNPWIFGNTPALGLILVGRLVTSLVDGTIVNPIDFWGLSAWPFGRGWGTPFHHRVVRVPEDR